MSRLDKKRERIVTVLFMFAVTFVCTSGVCAAYLTTRDRIRINEELFFKKAVLSAAGMEIPASGKEIDAVFESLVQELENVCYAVTSDKDNSETCYVFVQSGAGLWGEIVAVIGLDKDLRCITGIEFTKQNETPGLGAKIDESDFRNKFKGKFGPFTMLPSGEAANENQFDAITGATITSSAVENILNQVVERAGKMTKPEQQE
ncbi:FMN-binding protein [Candidatus Hydrogenedentota bacterium]